MDYNDPLYPIHDRKSKKKKMVDIVYYVLFTLFFALLGAICFLIYKFVQYEMTGRL